MQNQVPQISGMGLVIYHIKALSVVIETTLRNSRNTNETLRSGDYYLRRSLVTNLQIHKPLCSDFEIAEEFCVGCVLVFFVFRSNNPINYWNGMNDISN